MKEKNNFFNKVYDKLYGENCIFFHTEMSWRNVIVFSLICGVVVGLLMIPEFLTDTSLQMPGATTEFWFLAALFIILNCKKPLEAGFKTFVFFLISQPLIYLVQVPFSWRHWELFSYYPRWGVLTVASFFGAMLAWLVKKENFGSWLIFSVANLSFSAEFAYFFPYLMESFPKLLLTEIFLLAEMFYFTTLLFKKTHYRIMSAVFCVACAVGYALIFN